MARRSKKVVRIHVQVGTAIIHQTLTVTDFALSGDQPDGVRVTIPLRRFDPDTKVLDALLGTYVDRTSEDQDARDVLGLHLLARYLQPERVLSSRALTLSEIRTALHAGRGHEIRQFERYVAESAANAVATNLESMLVETLTGVPSARTAKIWDSVAKQEAKLITLVINEHVVARARIRRAGEQYKRFQKSELERAEAHRIRQLILRRLDDDRDALRVLAFRCVNHGDAIVDQANRLTLKVLTPQLTTSEKRMFEFLYLRRRSRVPPPAFDGIVANRPLLMGLLDLSPRTHAQLAATCFCSDATGARRVELENGLRRRMVGLLLAGQYVLNSAREKEAEEMRSRRDRTARAASASTIHLRAREVAPFTPLLSKRQAEVVARLAAGVPATEVGKELSISRQAVQNALGRAEDRARLMRTRLRG